MDIFSLRALWKALRGGSLTFALVFAMALLGFSFAGILRAPLRTIGIWAPLLFLLPLIATGLLAKHETRLPLQPRFKRLCGRLLVYGSIFLTLMIWRYGVWLREAYKDSFVPGPRYQEPARELPKGPRWRH